MENNKPVQKEQLLRRILERIENGIDIDDFHALDKALKLADRYLDRHSDDQFREGVEGLCACLVFHPGQYKNFTYKNKR